MVKFLSSWAKGLGLTIVIISILEMLLPSNKTQKYIRMVMGMYLIFNMISPVIENKNLFDFNKIDLEEYNSRETIASVVDQTSMDQRIEKLYAEELEKDIAKKIEQMGYKVMSCKVSTQIADSESETKIKKIKLNIDKNENQEEIKSKENNVENKIITEVQKIKKVEISTRDNTIDEKKIKTKIQGSDIQNIKKFLIEEYGVSEKCLEIS